MNINIIETGVKLIAAGALGASLLGGEGAAAPEPNASGSQDPYAPYRHPGNCITGGPEDTSIEFYGVEGRIGILTGGPGTEVGRGQKVTVLDEGNLKPSGHPSYVTGYLNKDGKTVWHYCEVETDP